VNKIFFALFLISSNLLAQDGTIIAARKFKKDLFRVGDVKISLLTTTEFAQVNGDCWQQLRAQDVSATDLPSKGISSVPDLSGKFIRNTGGNAAAMGTVQAESIVPHKHLQNDVHRQGAGSHTTANGEAYRGATGYVRGTTSSTRVSPYTGNTGETETKPVNLTVNTFIKVKEECGFTP